jgi:hypothetical protein
MISFIIFTILLLFIAYRTLKYTIKHFTPLSISILLFDITLLLIVWLMKFDFIAGELRERLILFSVSNFYWFSSILIMIFFIVLRDLHRNLYFERTTTDLVRKLSLEKPISKP